MTVNDQPIGVVMSLGVHIGVQFLISRVTLLQQCQSPLGLRTLLQLVQVVAIDGRAIFCSLIEALHVIGDGVRIFLIEENAQRKIVPVIFWLAWHRNVLGAEVVAAH